MLPQGQGQGQGQGQIRFMTPHSPSGGKISETFKGPLKYLLMPLLGKSQLAITLHMYASIGPNLDNTHRGQI